MMVLSKNRRMTFSLHLENIVKGGLTYIATRQMERVIVARYMILKMMQKPRQIFLQPLK